MVSKRRIGCKSQGSPEFTVVISFVMLVFLVVVLIVLQKQDESYTFQRFLDAKRVATSIADNINMISINGHGYYRYFSVSEMLHGNTEYNISASDNFLWINYADENTAAPLVTENVTIVHLEKGEDEVNCVSNHHGEVIINDICGLSDQGCGVIHVCPVAVCEGPDHNPSCDSPEPAEIGQNSISECTFYGCSTEEWHAYKVVPDRDGSLEITFEGTGTMPGAPGGQKSDLVFYRYSEDGGCVDDSDIVVWDMEPQANHIYDVSAGETYIIGIDVDSTGCEFNGTYVLTTELK